MTRGFRGAREAAGRGTLLAVWLLSACASSDITVASHNESAVPETDLVLGVATPEEVLARVPEWVDELVRSEPIEETALRLATPSPGVEVEVFFGSWCSDSRRELARLWRALEIAGGEAGFPIRYVGIDRNKQEPNDLVAGRQILYVPTLIVSKGGAEVGRIIESSPAGVEADLLDLVRGDASGWVSGRDDLEPPDAAGDSR